MSKFEPENHNIPTHEREVVTAVSERVGDNWTGPILIAHGDGAQGND